MWTLVFINLIYNVDSGYQEPVIEAWYDNYSTMEKCFMAREMLLLDLGIVDGYFPQGTQAICIQEAE